MSRWVHMVSGAASAKPGGCIHVHKDGRITETLRRWQFCSTTLERLARLVLSDPRFLCNGSVEDYLMGSKQPACRALRLTESPLSRIWAAARSLAHCASTQAAYDAADQINRISQIAKRFLDKMDWLRIELEAIEHVDCLEAETQALRCSVRTIDARMHKIRQCEAPKTAALKRAWEDAVDCVDILAQSNRELCMDSITASCLGEFLRVTQAGRRTLSIVDLDDELAVQRASYLEGPALLNCLALSRVQEMRLEKGIDQLQDLDGASCVALRQDWQEMLAARAQLSDPNAALNRIYLSLMDRPYAELLQAGKQLKGSEQQLYLLRIRHRDPEAQGLSQAQKRSLEHLDTKMRVLQRTERLVGDGLLARLLREELQPGTSLLDALKETAKRLAQLSPCDPSIALYMDVIHQLAQENGAPDAQHKDLKQLRESYLGVMNAQDRCALDLLAKLHGARSMQDGKRLVRCGAERLFVSPEVIAGLRDWDPALLERLDELKEHSFEPAATSLSELQGRLVSTDAQMSPVLLSCLVMLLTQGYLPEEIGRLYGEQLNAVLGWLHPVEPPLTWQRLPA